MFSNIQVFASTNSSWWHPFKTAATDRYYTGWQDPRSFITRLNFSKNFNMEDTLLERAPLANWDFNGVALSVDARIASEIQFYRNEYLSVGIAGGMDILMFGRRDGRFDVYDFSGQFTPYLDIWLQKFIDIKLRIYPFYHQSTHYVDGYRGDIPSSRGSSYEFATLEVFYIIYGFTIYSAIDATFHAVGNGAQLFRGSLGIDYRYPILPIDINIIAGIHIAAVYDKQDSGGFIKEPWHPAINFGVGLEFYSYTASLKIGWQRGRGATLYHAMQTTVGFEIASFW